MFTLYIFAPDMGNLTKILDKSEEQFFRVGIKSVTMDDIARELGMSKKTLYLFVDNKKDLVEKVMKRYIDKEALFFHNIGDCKLNAIDIIVEIIKHVHNALGNLPLSAIYDLQKYYPKSWSLFTGFKDEFIFKSMEAIIRQGKEEGLFRENIKEPLIARFYVLAIEGTLNPLSFPSNQFNFKETYTEYITYHLHGLASESGLQYLKKIKLNNE